MFNIEPLRSEGEDPIYRPQDYGLSWTLNMGSYFNNIVILNNEDNYYFLHHKRHITTSNWLDFDHI